ncbi:MAG TPA: hypothetical protein VLA16_15150, partial [Ideonella sp.]|nr:hypothetical protein [Ideonella sp.]
SWQQAFSHAPGGELDLSALEGGAPAAAGAAGAAAGDAQALLDPFALAGWTDHKPAVAAWQSATPD